MSDLYLEDLPDEDLTLSQRGLELLKGKAVAKYRFDSKRKELFIEFDDGTRIFIDGVANKGQISGG